MSSACSAGCDLVCVQHTGLQQLFEGLQVEVQTLKTRLPPPSELQRLKEGLGALYTLQQEVKTLQGVSGDLTALQSQQAQHKVDACVLARLGWRRGQR